MSSRPPVSVTATDAAVCESAQGWIGAGGCCPQGLMAVLAFGGGGGRYGVAGAGAWGGAAAACGAPSPRADILVPLLWPRRHTPGAVFPHPLYNSWLSKVWSKQPARGNETVQEHTSTIGWEL